VTPGPQKFLSSASGPVSSCNITVVWEIIMQSEPHVDVDPVDVGALIRDTGLTPKIPDNCSPLLRQLMEMCWQREPEQRPTIEVIVAMLSSSQIVGTG
jgi:hypothetical protein